MAVFKKQLVNRDKLRRAVADYMRSEGCSCCQNVKEHDKQKAILAKLLKVPKYSDGSGFDFNRFATNPFKID